MMTTENIVKIAIAGGLNPDITNIDTINDKFSSFGYTDEDTNEIIKDIITDPRDYDNFLNSYNSNKEDYGVGFDGYNSNTYCDGTFNKLINIIGEDSSTSELYPIRPNWERFF